MKRFRVLIITGLVSGILFFACKKSQDAGGSTPVSPPVDLDIAVTATIQGRVTGPDDVPV